MTPKMKSEHRFAGGPPDSCAESLPAARAKPLRRTELVLRAWVTALFVFFGVVKLADPAGSALTARSFGFPEWSWLLIGALEVAAATALWIRPATGRAATVLAIIMAGAVTTHLWNGVSVRVPLAVFSFVGALFLLWARQRSFAGRSSLG